MSVAVIDPGLAERADATTGRHYRKLTAEIVTTGRRRANEGEEVPVIAKDLEVNYAALLVAISGKTWRHLDAVAPPRAVRRAATRTVSRDEAVSLARRVAEGETVTSVAKSADLTTHVLLNTFARQFIADAKSGSEATSERSS
jgi:hypothetical protein